MKESPEQIADVSGLIEARRRCGLATSPSHGSMGQDTVAEALAGGRFNVVSIEPFVGEW